jgi:cbb3-type cytochrome oxidase maturation protein
MNIIVVLIAISLAIALIFLGIFFWNIKSGQYDDTESPAMRMLFEDKAKKKHE